MGKCWLTTDEAVVYLKYKSRVALLSARSRGNAPPAVRIGRVLRWDRDTIDSWLKERETATGNGLGNRAVHP